MKQILEFLKKLAANNNRDWFNEHKTEYLEVKAKIELLAQELINQVASFDPDAAHLSVSDCTYRIYRDTRFSSDKTPYKSHIGIFINPPFGKKSNRMGYYLHIEPGNCMCCTGTVCLPSKTVTAIRREIADNIDEFIEIVDNPEFKKIYPTFGFNCVKTAPKGFSRDWPYLDYVKPRDYCTEHSLSDHEMLKSNLAEKVGEMFRIGKPFNDFINYVIDENPE